jgi:hypothetical protein
MNSLTTLLLEVLDDSSISCGIDTSQDRKTILARVDSEGEAFLTITLPTMVKDLYKALDQSCVTENLFRPFKRKRGEALPVFLGGFFRLLFDPVTGGLRHVSSPSQEMDMVKAIRAIVQISGLHGKLFELCNPERNSAALAKYVVNDARVKQSDLELEGNLKSLGISKRELRVAMHVLYGGPLRSANADLLRGDLRPKHGPGSVADKLRGNAKWRQTSWPERLEETFPFGRWAFNSYLNFLDEVDAGHVAEPGTEIPVKVITVPKTQKTPRIIAVEPTAMQYLQQGVKDVLEKHLFSDKTANSVVGYKSQEPNQLLAREGSENGSLATLDLSDASDLVSYALAEYAFHDWPALWQAMDATRSRQARVLGEVYDLNKFASMGSALCFPVEAMLFSAIALIGMRRALSPTGTMESLLQRYHGKVRVYGDDIIVPVDSAQSVVETLEAFGLRVNRDKSFWTGRFRESCGKEYWRGHDVTYVKVRFRLPSLQKPLASDVESTIHTVALRNNFEQSKLFNGRTVGWLDALLERRLNGVFPTVASTSAALGKHGPFGLYETQRIDRDLQVPMVKAFTVVAISPSSKLDGYAALMKCLVNDSELPIQDPEHLLKAGRPVALRIKQRWVRSF